MRLITAAVGINAEYFLAVNVATSVKFATRTVRKYISRCRFYFGMGKSDERRVISSIRLHHAF